MALREDYNKSAEVRLQNRIKPYDLTKGEVDQVWKIAQDKDQSLQEEKQDYKENWVQRYVAEEDRLRGEQQPTPQNNLEPNQDQIGTAARMNVMRNHLSKLADIQRGADQKINAVLDQARHDGRGPTRGQDQTLSQDFNQEAQRTQDR
ncbi:hypothetical protein [Lewinella sp. JB7]|uniref:hypothetical protein n=1 Tax=Lewinella sp. JB7 TaxID=2962887 RepID=UPI0020C96835|nr:hypothetical protein [Lewinella sp. JB7]MCP9237908.1 hypothetical protein [Lewinella sp. JB7]